MRSRLPVMDNLGVTFKNKNERAEFMADRLRNHAALQKEINEPLRIDYAAFKKSKDEKLEHRTVVRIFNNKLSKKHNAIGKA